MTVEQINIIFFALLLGQLIAVMRSRLAGVIYYICISGFWYFSIWLFITWDLSRLCGLVLTLIASVKYQRPRSVPWGGSPQYLFLFVYIFVVTMVNYPFWPIEMITGRSSAYSTFRIGTALLNWGIVAGVSWQVAMALLEMGSFVKLRRGVIAIGVFHSLNALYQEIAFFTGLPMVGIRRTYIGTDVADYAVMNIGAATLYRPTSFCGEPRALAAYCVFWISVLFTFYIAGRAKVKTHVTLFLFLIVLFLTISTSGWGSFFCSLGLLFYLVSKGRRFHFSGFFVLALFIGVLFSVENSGILPHELTLKSIFEQRWTNRVSMENIATDNPDVETKEVLKQNPAFVIFGAGAGGMAFYIAKLMGGMDFIYASTEGWLCIIGDLGIIGLLLLVLAGWKGIRNLITKKGATLSEPAQLLAFVGCVCLFEYLVSAPNDLLSIGLGCLLASELYSRQNSQNILLTNKTLSPVWSR